VLIVHHLRRSQSERIVWLCDELGLDYTLRAYDRDPVTILAPPEYKALHPMGIAPVIQDGDVTLAESGAIVEYLIAKHGAGRLTVAPSDAAYPTYLYWLHFANGNLQPLMGRNMILRRLGPPDDNPVLLSTRGRLDLAMNNLDRHLAEATWLAGDTFTIADIMTVFSLTTMRLFYPLDLAPYTGIRAYLQRIGRRGAYRQAMTKGDPGWAPLLD